MSRGLNKVMLIGNLGADPEIRYTASGAPVANISLATAESWRDKDNGELREKTEWHRVVFFGKVAETVEKYVAKGSQLYIEGKLQTRKWQDKEGNDKYTTEVIGSEMRMLGKRGENLAEPENETKSPTKQTASNTGLQNEPAEFIDDDIPF